MTESPTSGWSGVACLLQDGPAATLKWKVLLATDLRRAELLAVARFEDLSPAGQRQAADSGFAPGDSVTLQLRAEHERGALVRIPAKGQALTVDWIGGVKEASPGGAGRGAAGKESSGCFVATAAFGSPLAAEIGVLRHVRDVHLGRTSAGARFLRAYARSGPRLARLVERSKVARTLARGVLAVVCHTIVLVERIRRCDR